MAPSIAAASATPPPLWRWLAVASGLFAAVVAAIAAFWAGLFVVLRRVWPLLSFTWSGAVGVAVVLGGVLSGLGLYFVLLRVVLQRTAGMSRERATGPAVYVGIMPLVGAVWLLSALAIAMALLS